MAIGAGFSKQAAAALLGNAQGESDANPTAAVSYTHLTLPTILLV